jgi:hypothetical protein
MCFKLRLITFFLMDMRSLLPDFLKPRAESGAKSKEEQAPPSTEQNLPEST